MTGEPPLTRHPEAPVGVGDSPARPLPGPGLSDYFAAPAPTAWAPPPPPAWPAPPPPPAWGAVPPYAGYAPPPPTWVPPPGEVSETGLPIPWALVVTGIGLVASFALNRYGGFLADPSQQVDTLLRRALVVTLFFYLVLGVALAVFVDRKRVGLTWHRGGIAPAVLLGLPLGALGGGLAVWLNSTLAGHLASDPRVELLVGGGGGLRVLLAFAVTAVLAPLVEETLFRGVLAGSMRAKGVGPAVWVSALAFSVWHMTPSALRYYTLMGLLLAALWRARGLVCSMSAHAAFNGVLTIAAVAATTGVGHPLTFDALRFQVPGGWHQVTDRPLVGQLLLEGPGGAALDVVERPSPDHVPTTDELLADLQAGETGGRVQVVPGSERVVSVPAGEAVAADVRSRGQPGHVLQLVVDGSAYQLLVITGGSPAAERDWQVVVSSVAVA